MADRNDRLDHYTFDEHGKVIEEKYAELDIDNPRSVYNFLPSVLQETARVIPEEYFCLSFHELEAKAFRENALEGQIGSPDATCKYLHMSFWAEYERVQRFRLKRLDMTSVCRGICTQKYFMKLFDGDAAKLAWLLMPPKEYTWDLKSIYAMSLERMKEACAIAVDPLKPNTKLLDVIVKIHELIDTRLHGAIVQNINQRSLNVNLNANAQLPPGHEEEEKQKELTMEEVEEKLKELERASANLLPPAHNVDMIKQRTSDIIKRDGYPKS